MLDNRHQRGFSPQILATMNDPRIRQDENGPFIMSLSENSKVYFEDYYHFLRLAYERSTTERAYLNEKIAGQSGRVRANGNGFIVQRDGAGGGGECGDLVAAQRLAEDHRLSDLAEAGGAPTDALSQTLFDRDRAARGFDGLAAELDGAADPVGQSHARFPDRLGEVAEFQVGMCVD